MPSSRRGPFSLPKLPCILIFRQFFLISLLFIISAYPPPLTIKISLQRKFIEVYLFPRSLKQVLAPLFPAIFLLFLPCSSKPSGHPQYDRTKNIQTHAYADSHTTGLLKTSVRPFCYLLFLFFLSPVILLNVNYSSRELYGIFQQSFKSERSFLCYNPPSRLHPDMFPVVRFLSVICLF